MASDGGGILDELFVLYHGQHREPCRRSGRQGGEGVEIAKILREVCEKLRPRHHTGERIAIAHRLTHGDDVRRDAVAGEDAVDEQGSWLHAVGLERSDGGTHRLGKSLAEIAGEMARIGGGTVRT